MHNFALLVVDFLRLFVAQEEDDGSKEENRSSPAYGGKEKVLIASAVSLWRVVNSPTP
jgi:hypothetical protein